MAMIWHQYGHILQYLAVLYHGHIWQAERHLPIAIRLRNSVVSSPAMLKPFETSEIDRNSRLDRKKNRSKEV